MIHLVEYQTKRVHLERKDRDHLLRLLKASQDSQGNALFETLSPTTSDDEYEIRPGPYVGRIGLPSGETIDIASRFAFADILEVLRRSGQLPLHADRLRADFGVEHFVTEALARAFGREVERIVRGGLGKGYRARTFTQPPYPGVPHVSLHLGRFAGRPDRLVTRARRITTDVDFNQALALALDVLNHTPMSREVRLTLHRLAPVFGHVRRVPMAARDVAGIKLTNLTRRYEPALALAEIVLRGRSLAPTGGGSPGASLAFHMPPVWESFVAAVVQEAWGPLYQVRTQHQFALTDGGEMVSKGDVVVFDGPRVVALFDAKYKWGTDAPSSGDVYQMVTYCRRLGLDEATLVYPAPAKERTLSVQGTKVNVVGLDPSNIASFDCFGTRTRSAVRV